MQILYCSVALRRSPLDYFVSSSSRVAHNVFVDNNDRCVHGHAVKRPIRISLNQEICASLDRVAASEERSRSQVAERPIRAALASRAGPEPATPSSTKWLPT